MKFTYINLKNKIPYEMDMLGVIDQFKADGFRGEKLNGFVNSVKNWVTVKTKIYAIYRID